MKKLVLLLLCALFLVGCGNKEENSVKKATAKYINALKKGNLKAFKASVTEESFKEWTDLFSTEKEQKSMMDGTKTYMLKAPKPKFSDIKVDGDKATIKVKMVVKGEEFSEEPIKLVKVKGEWKVVNLESI